MRRPRRVNGIVSRGGGDRLAAMDRDFWLDKWDRDEIGFHKAAAHPALVAHIDRLGLPEGGRVFLPLCGKTRDIGWLRARGYRVAGIEFSQRAVDALFADLGVAPERTREDALTRHAVPGLDIFTGDVFDLDADRLGPVDGVYDRAALVALPEGTRPRYAAHVGTLTDCAPQLLISFEYDQAAMRGPPFAVDASALEGYYGDGYDLALLARDPVAGGLKGRCPADETVWLLRGKG